MTKSDSKIGDEPYSTNKLQERNIMIVRRDGKEYYRVAVMYGGKLHSGECHSLKEAIKLREEFRHKHWPNYLKKQVGKKPRYPTVAKYVIDYSAKHKDGRQHLTVSFRKNGKYVYVGTYDNLEKAIRNRDLAMQGLPTEKSDKARSKVVKRNTNTEKYIVDFSKRYSKGKHYGVLVPRNGKQVYIGTYDSLEKAKKNRDLAILGKKTEPSDRAKKMVNKNLREPSIYPGIVDISSTLANNRKGYTATVHKDGQRHYLGRFPSVAEAKKAQEDFFNRQVHRKAGDLTGKVFGHLTVIRKGNPYVSPKGVKKVRWLCQCDCGKQIQTFTHSLTSGQTKSCGHARLDYMKSKSPVIDLTGQRFGQLVVIKDDGTRERRAVKWLCQCDCGRTTRVIGKNLQSGGITSCGHDMDQIRKETLKKYVEDYQKKTPGTRLDSLGTKASKNNQLGERNISIVRYKGQERYRVAVMYKRHQYGGIRDTLEKAIELREQLRKKYWPNYGK